jgi:hypothetical protein
MRTACHASDGEAEEMHDVLFTELNRSQIL